MTQYVVIPPIVREYIKDPKGTSHTTIIIIVAVLHTVLRTAAISLGQQELVVCAMQ